MNGFLLRRALGGLLVLGLILIGTGCGQTDGRTPVYPAKGVVFYEDKPAAGAVIMLHPLSPQPAGTPLPRARAGADGSFVLTTHITGDGAPRGEHAVTITWRQPTDHPEQEGPSLIPPRFGDPKTSGLKVTIEPQTNELPTIRLSRKP